MSNDVRFYRWKTMAEQLEMTVCGDDRAQNGAAGMTLWRGAAVLYLIELTAL